MIHFSVRRVAEYTRKIQRQNRLRDQLIALFQNALVEKKLTFPAPVAAGEGPPVAPTPGTS